MVIKNKMKKRLFLLLTLIMLNPNLVYAEKLASILKGKVLATSFSGLQALIKESDGSILDFADITASGTFKLDLTIMDTPSEPEVRKLTLEIKNKAGLIKKYPINQYITRFDDTVTLKPITFK